MIAHLSYVRTYIHTYIHTYSNKQALEAFEKALIIYDKLHGAGNHPDWALTVCMYVCVYACMYVFACVVALYRQEHNTLLKSMMIN